MTNNSATGGPLLPGSSSTPLSGAPLLSFLQGWLAPLCGLDPTLVRPRWQSEPSNIPDAGTAWMAFGFVGDQESDTFPYVSQSADGLSFTLTRNEQRSLVCSFYDTGVTGEADYMSQLLRDNLSISQNCEPLIAQGFQLAYVGPRVAAPRTLSTRWVYRVDLPVVVRDQFTRTYQVLTVESATGEVYTDVGYDFPLTASGG